MSDRWLPVSPVTGQLDAFQWKVPVAELGTCDRMPVLIDMAPRYPVAASEALPRPQAAEAPHLAREQDRPREVASPPLGNEAAENAARPAVGGIAARRGSATAAARPAPIIPLAQVPDDPGPEPDAEAELAAAPRADTWQRFRQLFR